MIQILKKKLKPRIKARIRKGKQILKKKLRPRIEARIRKNKQILEQNIGNFFDWVRGAELVELKKFYDQNLF